jgi:hypothetical protein
MTCHVGERVHGAHCGLIASALPIVRTFALWGEDPTALKPKRKFFAFLSCSSVLMRVCLVVGFDTDA